MGPWVRIPPSPPSPFAFGTCRMGICKVFNVPTARDVCPRCVPKFQRLEWKLVEDGRTWRSTQVAIRGSPAKGVGGLKPCRSSNLLFSANNKSLKANLLLGFCFARFTPHEASLIDSLPPHAVSLSHVIAFAAALFEAYSKWA